MSVKMKEKFDKYWKKIQCCLAFGAILDPRLKDKFLKFCYTTLDDSTSKSKLDNVMDKFKELYEEYVSYSTNQGVSLSQSSYELNSLAKLPREGKAKKSKIIRYRKSPLRRRFIDLVLSARGCFFLVSGCFTISYHHMYRSNDFKSWNSIESRFVPEKSELDIYFDDELMDLDEEHSEDFDVLIYWKFNEKKFPILSIMARFSP
ncbi:unnamed protein product [Vicia faba]|uniref:hAT-like transposase RNase-H fold domain-containing protein n=1 Tax=Vicia faba TaxID=3906 RepID=A0AAV1A3D4_VICFA|nr:unnamed protein product [Vicia faba]